MARAAYKKLRPGITPAALINPINLRYMPLLAAST
jgi:hypothetical protein